MSLDSVASSKKQEKMVVEIFQNLVERRHYGSARNFLRELDEDKQRYISKNPECSLYLRELEVCEV